MLDDLLSKKLILVTGKGGIGKSLTAASLAQYASTQGKKVCLVESNAQEQIGPLFGFSKIGHNLTEVANNVFAINLNPQENFRDFVVLHLGFAKLFEKVFTKTLVKSFINMLPGITELTLLGRLYYMSELDSKHNFDIVILDGYASGHFLSLLKTPDAVLNSGLVGPVIKETKDVKDFIFNRELVSVVLVTMPESLIVGEALDFSKKFQEGIEVPFTHLMVNKCLMLKPDEASSLVDAKPSDPVSSYLKNRLDIEVSSLDQLKSGLKEIYKGSDKWPLLFLLPDLGAVKEPVASSFAGSWFSRAERVIL